MIDRLYYRSSPNVVFTVDIVNHTILRIKHLFQNGRALLMCRIFSTPTTGNPDVEKSTRSLRHLRHVRANVNSHFKTVRVLFSRCLLLFLSSLLFAASPSYTIVLRFDLVADTLLIFVFFLAKIHISSFSYCLAKTQQLFSSSFASC